MAIGKRVDVRLIRRPWRLDARDPAGVTARCAGESPRHFDEAGGDFGGGAFPRVEHRAGVAVQPQRLHAGCARAADVERVAGDEPGVAGHRTGAGEEMPTHCGGGLECAHFVDADHAVQVCVDAGIVEQLFDVVRMAVGERIHFYPRFRQLFESGTHIIKRRQCQITIHQRRARRCRQIGAWNIATEIQRLPGADVEVAVGFHQARRTFWIPAFAGMTNSKTASYSRTTRVPVVWRSKALS